MKFEREEGKAGKNKLWMRKVQLTKQGPSRQSFVNIFWVREHLISSQFFSKRNAFRNGGRGVAPVSDGKSQIAHFHRKGKLILKKLSKFGWSPGVRLCHCSNPGRSTIHRRRACPAFAKCPGAWAGPGVAPPAHLARGPLRAGAVARLPSARVHENMTILLLLHVQCTLRTRTRHRQIAWESFFFVWWGHDVSTAEPFWKTCSQKSGSVPFSIQPLWEVCKCLRCLQSRSASGGGQAQSRRFMERDEEWKKRGKSGDDVDGWSFSWGEGQ